MIELDELYERQRALDERKGNFFGDDHNPNYGDRGYQDILEELDEINEQIDDYDTKSCTACKWSHAAFTYKCEDCVGYSNFIKDEE
jgi:hypothetical protein